MTSYRALIKHLFQVNLHGNMKLGLDNMNLLNQALNHPTKQFSSIQVAGTNGKGSVTTKIAKGLQLSGFNSGLYTSPHISCFRERIKINEEMISEEDAASILRMLFQIKETQKVPCTFFELVTALAFSYFAKKKVDFAVLETGLGGRLDATNIVLPKLSVITSISLDHTTILGNSIEEITLEKAGIIKPGIPVIIGPRVPFRMIEEVALKNKSPLIQVKGTYENFEEENNAIAATALELLNVHPSIIAESLKFRPPCRMETLEHQGKIFVLDVAHNPDGLTHLFASLNKKFPNHSFRIIVGLSQNKDIDACAAILQKQGSHFHIVTAKNGRGIPASDLKTHFKKATIHNSVGEAINEAMAFNEIIVICGTFFIMAEARKALGYFEPQDEIDMNERSMSST